MLPFPFQHVEKQTKRGSKTLCTVMLWTSVLLMVASCFAQEVDECSSPQLASGTTGLLQRVVDLKDTLGYAGLDSVLRMKTEEDEFDTCVLNIARMKNKAGHLVSPTAEGAQAAVRSKAAAFLDSSCSGFGLCAEVHDGPDADVWPLSTLTYLIVPTNATDEEEGCDKMKTLYDFVKWILVDPAASDIAKGLSMATMPQIIAEQAVAILDRMQCRDLDGISRPVKDRVTRAEALEGSGLSLQGKLQTKLTNAYFQQSFISIAYTSSSSGTGRGALRDFQVDFAGSDSILDMSDPEFARRGMKMIPAFAAAVALVYNLDGADNLVLTRAAVDGIFSGSITSWANAEIRTENPDAFLPENAIVRVVRAAKSGTTQALTKAAYSFAELPEGSMLDYAAHPLGGSGLPDWPIPALPYGDGAVCRIRSCIKQVCEPGQWLDLTSESCLPCPEGFFSTERGQHTACAACPPGLYANSEGNSKCSKCDDTQYQDGVGARECKACPANTRRFFVTVGGAGVLEETPGESVSECKCLAGFWLPAAVNRTDLGGEACEACPNGAMCEGFSNQQQIPAPKKDYWGDPAHPGRFIECRTRSCKGGYTCEEGHTGRLCTAPAEGHFTLGQLWFPQCPQESAARTVMVLCLGAGLVGLWVALRDLCFGSLDAVAVVVGVLQALCLISKMRLRWHPAIEAATAVLALVNFDVGFVGWQCVASSWDGASVFFLQLCLPFILTALSIIVYCLRSYGAARSHPASHDKTIRSKGVLRSPNYIPDRAATYLQVRLLSFVVVMYHTLVMYSVAPFVCSAEPDGDTHFVALLPEVKCGSEKHRAMRIFAILYIILILIPVPVFLARFARPSHDLTLDVADAPWGSKLRRGMRRNELNLYDFMEQFGFLYLKFRVDEPLWELVLMARKALLSLVLVTVSVPMIQAVLAVVVINVAMCLHLVCKPMVHRPAARLEATGLFCALVMAVSGMIFFPSLDNSVECVGSSDLVASVGDQCLSNQALKARVAALLLVLFSLLGLAAVLVSALEAHARLLARKATDRMDSVAKEQRQRGVLPPVDGWEEDGNGATWKGVGRASEQSDSEADGDADPHRLRLCHMIPGYHLHRWQLRLARLGHAGASRWQRVRDHVGLHREELAYLQTDQALAKFATIFDHASGFYVRGELAGKLRELEEALPLLVDWLAHAEQGLRKDFALAVQSLSLFCCNHRSRAFHDAVVTEYRAPVLHWLMRCQDEQRRSFRVVFSAITAAAGTGPGTLSDFGFGIRQCDDRVVDMRQVGTPIASPLTKTPRPPSGAVQSPTPIRPAAAASNMQATDGGWGQDAAALAIPEVEAATGPAVSASRQRVGSVMMADSTEICEVHEDGAG